MNYLTTAIKYLGKHEQKDHVMLTKLLGIDPRKLAWCAAFVNAILKKHGVKGTGSLAARSFLKIGQKVQVPQEGDIVVLSRGNSSWQGHVGFYAGENSRQIILLGGNQANSVCYRKYGKERLLGYRRV